ncbi:hypothetical protein FK220_011155 [Flavobacteriaceae bacterium TP-CH-4]|uniref:Lipoprotein n=1 Tax=Pelagihabitans pacificus TaxID=2696054 RepID=A0A967AT55_9FLAO|nr:hypothetical protein [Pelagihabitans pacificus]NHF59901.1 hypothetical protein [Pelagihabitans pacificus]
MKSFVFNVKQLLLLSAVSLMVFACSKDGDDPINDSAELSKTEVKTVLEADEISGITDEVVTEIFQNGQSSAKSAKTVDCYEATYTETGFTATFINCGEEDGNLNGTISAIYEMGDAGTVISVTFTDFMAGDISINGTRTFTFSNTDTENITYNVTSDMTIIMADGSVIKEKGAKTLGLVFGENFSEGKFTLDGNWTIEANGNTYFANITTLLETTFGCEHVGTGVLVLAKNGLEVSVDFGDGTCDDMATLIYPDGTEEEFSLKD